MQTGISIYPGLDNTPKENLQLIESAARLGITRIFTSLHIPETDHSALKEEFSTIVQAARSHDMEIISDISPETRTSRHAPLLPLSIPIHGHPYTAH